MRAADSSRVAGAPHARPRGRPAGGPGPGSRWTESTGRPPSGVRPECRAARPVSHLDVVVRLTVGLPLVRAAPALAEGGGPAAGGPADLRPVQAASWQLLRGVCGVVWNAGFLAESPRRPVPGRQLLFDLRRPLGLSHTTHMHPQRRCQATVPRDVAAKRTGLRLAVCSSSLAWDPTPPLGFNFLLRAARGTRKTTATQQQRQR